jgi:two-component system, NarL family, sensor histidine kinase DesK
MFSARAMIKRFVKQHPNSLAQQFLRGGAPSNTLSSLPLVNLVWMFWMVAAPWMTGKPSARVVILTGASVVIFLFLYLRAWYGDRVHAIAYTIAIAVLGLAIIPINSSWSYVIYASVLINFCLPIRSGLFWLGMLMLAFFFVTYQSGYPAKIAAACVLSCLSISLINLFIRFNMRRDADLRLSHEEVRRLAATAERERIGRDLHDLLGHTLSLIALKSELADKLFDRDLVAARQELRDVQQVARESLAQVRSAVTGIRTAAITAELASAKLLLGFGGIALNSHCPELMPLDPKHEAALALCLREAVTNIQRHSGARNATIRLDQNNDVITLCIDDDGCGNINRHGNGLNGMRERLSTLGGRLVIHSPSGHGTELIITLPCTSAPSGSAVITRENPRAALPADDALSTAVLPEAVLR